MFLMRKRIKKTIRNFPLRKKMNGLKKNSNDKKVYIWIEDTVQKNDRALNIITLFPNKA